LAPPVFEVDVLRKGVSLEALMFTALAAGDGVSEVIETALAAPVEAQAGEDRRFRVRILPIGAFAPRGHGKTLRVESVQHAHEIVAASRKYAGAQDIPVDYDHQLVYAAKDGIGGQAPASGWIAALGVDPDGIYAEGAWTERAAAAIRAREYRYLSPVVGHTQDGKILTISSVALTNMPAVDGLTQLAASRKSTPNQDNQMDRTLLAQLLGLDANATEAEIQTALTARLEAQTSAQAELTALRAALGASDQTTALSAVTAMKATTAGNEAQTALMASMQATLTALTAERNAGVVDAAIRAGKIIPAQREHFIALMASDEKTALALIGSAPTVVTGETQRAADPKTPVTALSAAQKQVCALTGVSEADYLKTLQAEAGQ
jgi:phage I-like protein